MAEIKVKISPDGSKTEVEVNGISGTSCEDLTAGLQNALGMTEKTEHTAEYFIQPDVMVDLGGS